MIQPGEAKVLHGDNNVLTRAPNTNNAVVELGADSYWKLHPVGEDQCMMILVGPAGEEEMAATLDCNSDPDGAINVVMRPIESPPCPEQLWSLEDAIAQMRYPPIVHARIQSVARKDMSMAIAGMVPLPRTMLNVACVPTDSVDREQLRWRLDYRIME